ncbi:MAG: hypothetical protein AAB636_01075 [Patescibacteria group bacterium]
MIKIMEIMEYRTERNKATVPLYIGKYTSPQSQGTNIIKNR